ncbi:MAG: transposase [Gammaproteobacteria bacterium]|nr:transposase [Gammaproteobacteria bacterium]
MGLSLEARFEKYCDTMVKTLLHADREQPARWYLKGLVLPGGRKSVEPMAARVQPQEARSAHQSMHHLVADAPWSDAAMLLAVAEAVLPKLVRDDEPVNWTVDDTGLPKKGQHSVGVAHQYCGQTGKLLCSYGSLEQQYRDSENGEKYRSHRMDPIHVVTPKFFRADYLRLSSRQLN